MKAMLAPLSPNEEATLRRIGFGSEGDLVASHIRRLLQLELIEWNDWRWRLTAMGRNRHEALVNGTQAPTKAAKSLTGAESPGA